MSVTLDVSRVSGWLNADAYCRAEKEEGIRRGARCELGDGRRWVTTAQRQRAGGGLEYTDWGQTRAERTLNMEDIVVTLDVLKLSGWLNALAYCRAEMRAYDAG